MLQRPNILFILTDQMRGDCISLLDHPVVETPYLDALGRSGVVFTKAYSSCPSCIASRASIFTGLSPSSHGRLGYQDQVPWRYSQILPKLLSDAGYDTYCVGKTHFYPQGALLGFHGLESYEGWQNFDYTYRNDYLEWLREHSGGRFDEFDHGLTGNSWLARPSHLPEELHNNSWMVTKSIEFLRNWDRRKPFFLNVSFHRPHPPFDPPGVMFDLYRDRTLPTVPMGDWARIHDVPVDGVEAWHGHLPEHLLSRARRAYYAQISHIDLQIGRLLGVLKREVRPGPTWIIFASDHGEMLGDHHLFRKTYAYEGSARIALMISPPDKPVGELCDAPVACEDLFPTILEIASIPSLCNTEGTSLLSYLEDPNRPHLRQYVHGEHAAFYSENEAMQFLTDGREKYIWFTLSGQELLFDLTNDPQETKNLASSAPWQARLGSWRSQLVEILAKRPQDGLSDGKNLIAGKLLPNVRKELLV